MTVIVGLFNSQKLKSLVLLQLYDRDQRSIVHKKKYEKRKYKNVKMP